METMTKTIGQMDLTMKIMKKHEEKMKYEALNPKYSTGRLTAETISNGRNSNDQNNARLRRAGILNLDNLCFGFVSDLDIRISDFFSAIFVAEKANHQSSIINNQLKESVYRTPKTANRLTIKTYKSQVAAKPAPVAANQTRLKANQTRLTAYPIRSKANQTRLEANLTGLMTNQTRLEANQTRLMANQTRLMANRTELVANPTRLKANYLSLRGEAAAVSIV